MPFCPRCKAEYLPGNTVCADCKEPLVDYLPEPDHDIDEKEAVFLCQNNDMALIGILEQTLREQGIPCLVKSSMGTFSGYQLMNSVMKGLKVFVMEEDLEKAKEIVEMIMPDSEETDDAD